MFPNFRLSGLAIYRDFFFLFLFLLQAKAASAQVSSLKSPTPSPSSSRERNQINRDSKGELVDSSPRFFGDSLRVAKNFSIAPGKSDLTPKSAQQWSESETSSVQSRIKRQPRLVKQGKSHKINPMKYVDQPQHSTISNSIFLDNEEDESGVVSKCLKTPHHNRTNSEKNLTAIENCKTSNSSAELKSSPPFDKLVKTKSVPNIVTKSMASHQDLSK